jgi:DNA-binding NarL/FixJ family response regulator
MVDWFDTDDRRYVLALPNPPSVADPRGLTQRERQVAAYAALGDNHKMIAYRLGVARSTVTKSLRRAMRKLGVKTQAGLVEKLRGFSFGAPDSGGAP